jgi:Flp pilus assembly secretin CpaC
MRRALIAATFLAASPALFAAGAALAAGPAGVAMGLDEVHTLTFKAPVATVYVGNPTIADVTMIDARHAFVQGKGYGRTNIVALNRDNVQVFNTAVTVTSPRESGTVTCGAASRWISG